MRYVAQVSGHKHTIELRENGHSRHVSFDGRELAVDWQLVGAERAPRAFSGDEPASQYSILIGDRSYDAYARVVEDADAAEGTGLAVEVMIQGRPYLVTVQDERSQALENLAGGKHISGDATIRAPMPGLVANILAAVGDEVTRGQTVVVLEAMKMENDLSAPRSGIVKAVRVEKGQTVNQGDALAVVGDPAGAATPDDDEE